MITQRRALSLLNEHIKTENIKKHLLAAEALMRALARKFGEDEERWGIAGLLHDLDWDYTKPTPEKHGLQSYEMLRSEDLDEEMLNAIKIYRRSRWARFLPWENWHHATLISNDI